ncbi:MAG TPA: UDP-N-acetylmuramoyl-L-alanine--D-glutamate ligase [Pirellulales bacterium]|jgi:UDP-N-acetylmuramoylalanine--D-glutamate ligase|nr:UDP-N-acetylmuramoyl-L-alanine--D-glutamate ligase [Pirellulales bacterium]
MRITGRRVTVMGLGRHGGGLGVARWLAEQGARVTVTDLADETALADSLAKLRGVPITRYRLGSHQEDDFTSADLIVVNPAVRPNSHFIAAARTAHVPLTSEVELFLDRCPGQVIAVTGSNGKSTTAAMIAAILTADGRRTWLGGNIGRSLLAELDLMTPDDWIVLELSSFQLWWLNDASRWPEIGIITNCTPNHRDWHGTFDAYQRAKARLLSQQRGEGTVVLNGGDPVVLGWRHLARGRVHVVQTDDPVPPLGVPGAHNRRNAACAAAAAEAARCSPAAIRRGLQDFRGLPHRLELVAEIDGRSFFNDSMATTPESVMAAIDAFPERAWFLVGGHDKGFDYAAMTTKLARLARGVACFGAARHTIAAMIERQPTPRCAGASFATMEESLAWCWSHSRAGEAIVLSPACASFDQFRDYRHRGETFAALALSLDEERASHR